MDETRFKPDTVITHAGRDPAANHGIVNPPVYHASTILAQTLAEYEERRKHPYDQPTYGRLGTPTTDAFETAVAALEGGYRAVATSSGLAAISVALLAYLEQGDHLLVPDNAYGPVRARLCNLVLRRMGVETTYYDPQIGAGIAELIRPNTRVIYMESPGSLTFEMQDIPAITAVARDRGVITVFDNTWAGGYFLRPLSLGVDIVLQAATKYLVGHSDAMLGTTVASTRAQFEAIKGMANALGHSAAPDDCYLGQRGLRTLAVRLHRHQETGLRLARWLQQRPEVDRVMHPGLPEDPGHAIWQRDFTGASGLFGVVLHDVPKTAVAALLDGLELFGMGASWGGYESLAILTHPDAARTATKWQAPGPCLRLHAGLEDAEDLIRDLEAGFHRLNAEAAAAPAAQVG